MARRGLSDLQIFILQYAARYEWARHIDILLYYFKWEPEKPLEFYTTERREIDPATGREVLVITPPGRIGLPRIGLTTFKPERIGRERYNRTMAALSRSCARLRQRGFVETRRSKHGYLAAVVITDEGRAFLEAKGLIPKGSDVDPCLATH